MTADVAARPWRRGHAWTAIVAVVALLLAWRVVVSGTTALQFGDTAALGLRPLAPVTADAPETAWRAQIAQNPADYVALVSLAREFERQGKIADARAAMGEALGLAPVDRRTLLEAGAFHLRHGDAGSALPILRRAADLHPDVRERMWPVFAAALDGGRAEEFFAGVARANPEWWPEFFRYACQKSADADALQRVFAARLAASVADAGERRCLIDRLQRDDRWAHAYQVWLNSLPAAQRQRVGYVFNGRFEWPLSNVGFDWTMPAQQNVDVQVAPLEGATGRRALRVEFVNKLWEAPPVQQYLMLVPGRYRLEGRGRADGLQTWLGIQWGLYCLPRSGRGERQLVRSGRFVGTSGWEDLRGEFTVPGDCPVQLLRLELANPRRDADTPGGGAVRLRGTVWFDDLRVRSLD
ncbi:MAG: hypothetical protein U1F58_11480 [Burkholderiales bacterium]